MKQFLLGILTIIIFSAVAVIAFRGTTTLMSRLFPASSQAPIASPLPSPSILPSPSAVLQPTHKPATKLPSPIKTTTTITSTSRLYLTLIKSNVCPVSYLTEVKDIVGELTLKYSLKDGYTAKITVWNKDGNELVSNTEVRNSGTLKTISGVDYLKVRIESGICSSTSDSWLIVTAER